MDYKTTVQAAKYIYDTVKIVDSSEEIIEIPQIQEILQEEITNRYELSMSEEDLDILENNSSDPNHFDNHMSNRFDDYQDILTDVVNEILTEYILDEEQ